MSKVKIQGHASGTGVLTVTAPNTSTDRTITLPDSTGTLIADNGSGKVGIGTSSPDGTAHIHTASAGSVTANTDSDDLVVENSGNGGISVLTPDASRSAIQFGHTSDNLQLQIRHDGATTLSQIISDDPVTFNVTDGSEAIRVTADGLTFNGDTAAANALDDYEEGEVTNALDINGTTQTSYASGRGNLQYTKVGRNVHVQAYIDTQGATLATTGALHIRLPFAVSAGSGTAFVTGVNFMYWSVNNVSTPCYTYLNEGDSTISGTNLISEGDGNAITGGSGISVSGTGHRVIMQYAFTYQTD